MPVPSHLLERAYQLINANQLDNAKLVLDAVVRVDPQNVDAWKAYLMIHQDQNDLDWLKERILKTSELSEINKTKLVNYYCYLTRQLKGIDMPGGRVSSFDLIRQEEAEVASSNHQTNVQFEMIDFFDYSAKVGRSEIRTRPRIRRHQRDIYNPFTRHTLNGIVEAVSQYPLGKKFIAYLKELSTFVSALLQDTETASKKLADVLRLEKYAELILLVSFFLGARLALLGNFLGYILLGIFIVVGRWWLNNYRIHQQPMNARQARIFLHEEKDTLPILKETGQEKETDEKD